MEQQYVRFEVQVVHADGVLGSRARVRVDVAQPWAEVTAKMNVKLRAAGGTEAEAEGGAGVKYAVASGAAVTDAEDIDQGETVFLLKGGAAVPGSGGGGQQPQPQPHPKLAGGAPEIAGDAPAAAAVVPVVDGSTTRHWQSHLRSIARRR